MGGSRNRGPEIRLIVVLFIPLLAQGLPAWAQTVPPPAEDVLLAASLPPAASGAAIDPTKEVAPPPPLAVDRPGYCTSASILPPGILQLEAGYSRSRAGFERRHAMGETVLSLAPNSRVELQVALNSFVLDAVERDRTSGRDDISFGAKFPLIIPASSSSLLRPAVSVDLHLTAPTGSEGIGGELVSPESRIVAEWTLPRGWMIRTNFGHALAGDEGVGFHQFGGGVRVAWSPSEKAGWYVEYYSFQPDAIRGRMSKYVDVGFGWAPNQNLIIDTWCGFGGHFDQREAMVGVGITQTWHLWGR